MGERILVTCMVHSFISADHLVLGRRVVGSDIGRRIALQHRHVDRHAFPKTQSVFAACDNCGSQRSGCFAKAAIVVPEDPNIVALVPACEAAALCWVVLDAGLRYHVPRLSICLSSLSTPAANSNGSIANPRRRWTCFDRLWKYSRLIG